MLIRALGIGTNTTIFSVVNALLFKPLPYKDAGRIVYVFEGKERVQSWGAVSSADFEDWKAQNRVFEQMALFSPDSVNLAVGGEPERVAAVRVSPEMISLLGLQPALGRAFLGEEYASGGDRSDLRSSRAAVTTKHTKTIGTSFVRLVCFVVAHVCSLIPAILLSCQGFFCC